MIRNTMVATVLTVSLVLGGCSGIFKADTTQLDVDATTVIENARGECYKSDSISSEGMTAMEYSLALANRGLRDVALAATGKPKCEGVVNVYNSQIAEVKAKTGMVTSVTHSVVTGSITAIGIGVAGDVLKTGFEQAGDNNTLSMGDSNTVTDGQTKSEVVQETHATAITSEGGTATPTVGSPVATVQPKEEPEVILDE